jgi:hypothetical protein
MLHSITAQKVPCQHLSAIPSMFLPFQNFSFSFYTYRLLNYHLWVNFIVVLIPSDRETCSQVAALICAFGQQISHVKHFAVLSRDWINIDGVWIGNRIYCTYTTRYYTSQITIRYTRSFQPAMSTLVVTWWLIPTMSFASVLTFLQAGDCPTTDSLLNCRLSTDWLTLTVLLKTPRHIQLRKYRPLLLIPIVACKHVCLWSRYTETAAIWLLISRSLLSNGSTFHSIIFSQKTIKTTRIHKKVSYFMRHLLQCYQ